MFYDELKICHVRKNVVFYLCVKRVSHLEHGNKYVRLTGVHVKNVMVPGQSIVIHARLRQ